eukprot:GHVS01101223.1.p1 GENE.GHVS01101223.1~~GHVS01101223.1.p1  ORF type:complete len:237 (-),score=68.11 GHVS01101223.1:1035-1646(-)
MAATAVAADTSEASEVLARASVATNTTAKLTAADTTAATSSPSLVALPRLRRARSRRALAARRRARTSASQRECRGNAIEEEMGGDRTAASCESREDCRSWDGDCRDEEEEDRQVFCTKLGEQEKADTICSSRRLSGNATRCNEDDEGSEGHDGGGIDGNVGDDWSDGYALYMEQRQRVLDMLAGSGGGALTPADEQLYAKEC